MGIWVGKEREDGSRFMQVWGKVSREPRIGKTRKGEPKIEFGVGYARNEFMNVMAAGESDTSTIAAALERGDIVEVKGVWSARKYTNRDGEEKTWSELRADTICPQGLLVSVLELLRLRDAQDGGSRSAEEADALADDEDDGPLPWDDYQPTI